MNIEPKPELALNRDGWRVADALKGFISHAATGFVDGASVDIATAYFNVGGYSLLADALERRPASESQTKDIAVEGNHRVEVSYPHDGVRPLQSHHFSSVVDLGRRITTNRRRGHPRRWIPAGSTPL